MSEWTERAPTAWERELHGLMLRVNDLCDTEQTDDILDALVDPGASWGWWVFRAVDRFTDIELESGQEETRELAICAAEVAAGTWR